MLGGFKMKLTVTDRAYQKIMAHVPLNSKLLLSFDDGVGPFSKVGVCSLDTAFDIIAVDPDANVPDYDQALLSNKGSWAYKGYSKIYLNENMKLDVKNNQLILSGDSGVLDSEVDIQDLTGQKV